MRPPPHRSRPREARAGSTTGAALGGWSKKTKRLNKHYGRWMDIVRSLQLESFILTKLTKPLVRVNLVGPQVSFRNGAPQMSGEESFFGG